MAYRRRAGLRGLQDDEERQAKMREIGGAMMEQEMAQMKESMEDFKAKLENFARKHKKDIKSNPAFRRDFQQMCTRIGVDPLASNHGFWSQLLGVGDFYYKLGIQVVESCLSARGVTGGLMELNELRIRVNRRRGSKVQQVSDDDILQAVRKLQKLGSGYKVIELGGKKLIQSVPMELSTDHNAVLSLAIDDFHVTATEVQTKLKWTADRVETTLSQLLRNGVAWLDTQGGETSYWFPGLMREVSMTADSAPDDD